MPGVAVASGQIRFSCCGVTSTVCVTCAAASKWTGDAAGIRAARRFTVRLRDGSVLTH